MINLTNVRDGLIAGLALALAISIITRPTQKPSIPIIVTKYDTVTVKEYQKDTLFLTKLRTVHDTVNLVQTVTTPAKVDTVKVFYPVSGIAGLLVGQRFGRDTTKVVTFTMTPVDSANSFTIQSKLYGYYTPGPLRSAVLTTEGTPNLTFYNPPSCHEGKAFLAGAGTATAFIFGGKLALNLFSHP